MTAPKDCCLNIRIDQNLKDQLTKKYKGNSSNIVRGLIQMFLKGEIPEVRYTQQEVVKAKT